MRVRPLLAGEIRLSSSFPACPPGRLGPLRGMVDQLAQGMVLKPAVKYRAVAQTFGVPRDNH